MYFLINKVGQWFHQPHHLREHAGFSKNLFWSVNCAMSFYHFNSTACAEVYISSKELHIQKYFHEKSYNHIYFFIYRPHLSRSILNLIQAFNWYQVRSQICKKYVLASNHEFYMRRCFKFRANWCIMVVPDLWSDR